MTELNPFGTDRPQISLTSDGDVEFSMTTPQVTTPDGMQFRVQIGTGTPTGSYYTSDTSDGTDDPQRLIATIPQASLTDNTKYNYLLETNLNAGGWIVPGDGIEGTFWSRRGSGSDTWSFVILGDQHLYRNNAPQANATVQAAKTMEVADADGPRLTFYIGDLFFLSSVWVSQESDVLDGWEFCRNWGTRGNSHEFLVLGNHEGEQSTPSEEGIYLQRWMTETRKRYWRNPDDGEVDTDTEWIDGREGDEVGGALNTSPLENYYKVSYGEVDFFVLDVERYTSLTLATSPEDVQGQVLGETQRQWLIAELAASTARFKIVLAHRPLISPYRGGIREIQTATNYSAMTLQSILLEGGVDAFLWGHDHLWYYANWNGITYMQVGASGTLLHIDSKLYKYWGMGGYQWGDYLGYVRGTVSGNSLKLEYVKVYDEPGTENPDHPVIGTVFLERKKKHGKSKSSVGSLDATRRL